MEKTVSLDKLPLWTLFLFITCCTIRFFLPALSPIHSHHPVGTSHPHNPYDLCLQLRIKSVFTRGLLSPKTKIVLLQQFLSIKCHTVRFFLPALSQDHSHHPVGTSTSRSPGSLSIAQNNSHLHTEHISPKTRLFCFNDSILHELATYASVTSPPYSLIFQTLKLDGLC